MHRRRSPPSSWLSVTARRCWPCGFAWPQPAAMASFRSVRSYGELRRRASNDSRGSCSARFRRASPSASLFPPASSENVLRCRDEGRARWVARQPLRRVGAQSRGAHARQSASDREVAAPVCPGELHVELVRARWPPRLAWMAHGPGDRSRVALRRTHDKKTTTPAKGCDRRLAATRLALIEEQRQHPTADLVRVGRLTAGDPGPAS